MDVVKRATEAVSARSPRTRLVLKADTGHTGQLAEKVRRVEEHLADE